MGQVTAKDVKTTAKSKTKAKGKAKGKAKKEEYKGQDENTRVFSICSSTGDLNSKLLS